MTSWVLHNIIFSRKEKIRFEISETHIAVQVTDKKFRFSYHIEIKNCTSGTVDEASVK